jgi:hypothetical protein
MPAESFGRGTSADWYNKSFFDKVKDVFGGV